MSNRETQGNDISTIVFSQYKNFIHPIKYSQKDVRRKNCATEAAQTGLFSHRGESCNECSNVCLGAPSTAHFFRQRGLASKQWSQSAPVAATRRSTALRTILSPRAPPQAGRFYQHTLHRMPSARPLDGLSDGLEGQGTLSTQAMQG